MNVFRPDEMLKQAAAMYQAGRLNEVETLCQHVLAVDSNNFEALRMLGLAQVQQQQIQAGMGLLRRALEVRPGHAETLYELGRALYRNGQIPTALECFEQVLNNNPEYAEASNARGIMLSDLGRHEEALASFQQAVVLAPRYASAYNNLGNAHLLAKRYGDALADFENAINIQPDFANAYNGRGSALLSLSRYEDALTSFEKAVSLQPEFSEAWCGCGNAMAELRRHEDALASYERALKLNLGGATIFENPAKDSQGDRRYTEALTRYRDFFERSPENLHIMCNVGKVLVRLGRHVKALELFDRVLAIKPYFEAAVMDKGVALRDLGYHDAALKMFEEAAIAQPDNLKFQGAFLFNLNYVANRTASEVFAWHRTFGERFEAPLRAGWLPHENVRAPEKPLRIGFVSADLRSHPVGYFLENVLANLRSGSLRLYAYANHETDDEVTDRLRPFFDVWHNIHTLTDDEVAHRIRADGIDILVDLSGHTVGNRLLVFARKPAPVQVTYLGYFASTGLMAMDYFLGDRWQMPEGERLHYTETPFRLPDHHLCFTPPNFDMPVGSLPALLNGYVTFGNFNNLAKMNDTVVRCWANILKAVPTSRLFLKSEPLDSRDVAARVYERFASHGIEGNRLILEGKSPYDAYLASYQRVDIALDPFPYAGGTVTVQALWMGVPVLTLHGDRHVSRNGSGIMQTMGMPEWVAMDEADYVDRAIAFASDLPALATLRSSLHDRFVSSSLCDAPRFARNLEQAFRSMWQAWCANPEFGFAQRGNGQEENARH